MQQPGKKRPAATKSPIGTHQKPTSTPKTVTPNIHQNS